MRFTTTALVLLTSISAVFAAPMPQGKDASMASALTDMITGAISVPKGALSGDNAAYNAALAQMMKGAESFSGGFFNDLGKAAGSAAPKGPASI